MQKKSLFDISWQVTEEEYRKDKALSYSTLARYDREGFNNLDKLFDKIETPSLTFGNCVDSLTTGGEEEFNSRFIIAEYPSIPDSIITIVKELFQWCHTTNNTLSSIKDDFIIQIASKYNYQNNWKPETRAKVIKEKGSEYYKLLYITGDKTLIDTQTYQDVLKAVDALKNSEATKWYFAPNNPFEDIERFYQLKFKACLEGVEYRCMADLIICCYDTKEIFLIDLKTSSHTEWDFYVSFIEWKYAHQSRLYYRIIKNVLSKDDYFKDFKIHDYRFIVVNKKTLTPLVWEYKDTTALGTLYYGSKQQYVFKDPYDIGKELYYYLNNSVKVPKGINLNETNDIRTWINTL